MITVIHASLCHLIGEPTAVSFLFDASCAAWSVVYRYPPNSPVIMADGDRFELPLGDELAHDATEKLRRLLKDAGYEVSP